MEDDRDYNDIINDAFLAEEKIAKIAYEAGLADGKRIGNRDGFHLGYHRGAELGRELGYYLGVVSYHLELNTTQEKVYSNKILSLLTKVKELIDIFPKENSENHDLIEMADVIRAKYKKTCAFLKIPADNPYYKDFSF